jgi:hypothetical protein
MAAPQSQIYAVPGRMTEKASTRAASSMSRRLEERRKSQ